MAMCASTTLSVVRVIKPLFRDEDQSNMLGFGLDLYDYERVKDRAAEILKRLADGSMLCDEVWPEDRCSGAGWTGLPRHDRRQERDMQGLGQGARAPAEPHLAPV